MEEASMGDDEVQAYAMNLLHDTNLPTISSAAPVNMSILLCTLELTNNLMENE